MYSSEDFERLFIRYKSESYPKGESIQTFCHRNNVPYNLFEKWYKDTRHRVVEVDVSGRPSPTETDTAEEEVQVQKEKTEVRILVDLHISNGLRLRQGNLSYGQLKRLVEKLEGLC
jgi:transposase-like protein